MLPLSCRYPPQLAMHTMTVLEEGEGGPCTLFDFLPCNPTDAGTGARLDTPHSRRKSSCTCCPFYIAAPPGHGAVMATRTGARGTAVSTGRLLAGGSAPGRVRTRRLSRLPPRRCRLVAELNTITLPEVGQLLHPDCSVEATRAKQSVQDDVPPVTDEMRCISGPIVADAKDAKRQMTGCHSGMNCTVSAADRLEIIAVKTSWCACAGAGGGRGLPGRVGCQAAAVSARLPSSHGGAGDPPDGLPKRRSAAAVKAPCAFVETMTKRR